MTISEKGFEIATQLGGLNAKVEKLENAMDATQKDVREIRDTLTGANGSWKTLTVIGSLSLTLILSVGWNIIEWFTGK